MKLDETISRYLLTARYHAESGEARIMEEILSLLKDVPSIDDQISKQIQKIRDFGYLNAIPVELSVASYFAGKGQVSRMEDFLSSAIEYAGRSQQDISAKVAEIRALIKK